MIIISEKFEISKHSQCAELRSFVNLYSIKALLANRVDWREKKCVFYCDGFLLCVLLGILFRKKIKRFSFDFTSIADEVFMDAVEHRKSIGFLGGTMSEIEIFREKVLARHSQLNVAFAHDGFSISEPVLREILETEPSVIVVGLGTPMQEHMGLKLIDYGFEGVVYTCGGFITQTANISKTDYYPSWVNRLNLRFAHRFIKEPHTRKRYLINYPMNAIHVMLYWKRLINLREL